MFPLEVRNAHSRRACELVAAFEEHEITVAEFDEVMGQLSPEILQVTAAVLSHWAELYPERSARLLSAGAYCRKRASQHRIWN
jgi:hypothetical protein